jgi:hypothetical protein
LVGAATALDGQEVQGRDFHQADLLLGLIVKIPQYLGVIDFHNASYNLVIIYSKTRINLLVSFVKSILNYCYYDYCI